MCARTTISMRCLRLARRFRKARLSAQFAPHPYEIHLFFLCPCVISFVALYTIKEAAPNRDRSNLRAPRLTRLHPTQNQNTKIEPADSRYDWGTKRRQVTYFQTHLNFERITEECVAKIITSIFGPCNIQEQCIHKNSQMSWPSP